MNTYRAFPGSDGVSKWRAGGRYLSKASVMLCYGGENE